MLEAGGFLGVGEKRIAFPLSRFSPGPCGSLMLDVERPDLEHAEGLGREGWPGRAYPGHPERSAAQHFMRASELVARSGAA